METRQTVRHWEGDLINGVRETGRLVTLVERNTRFTLIKRTDSKEAKDVIETICRLFAALPAKPDARQRKGICPPRADRAEDPS